MFSFFNPLEFQELISGRRRGILAASLRGLLRVMESPYSWAVKLRNQRYDRGWNHIHRVDVPVVSVGNLTTGGTGKTPLVAWLANWFTQHGLRVTLVSRGYRSPAHTTGEENAGNDEARELAHRLPHIPHLQNPDRVAAAQRAASEFACDLVVLDDAFQHRRIHRDVDIVLLDALQPFGYGHLLPRGLLREPVQGLARADLIALSRADTVDHTQRRQLQREVAAVAPEAAWIELVHRPQSLLNSRRQSAPVKQLSGQRVAAFAGIGNPKGFRHSLKQIGCELVDCRELPDHFHYDRDDLIDLGKWIDTLGRVDAVVCTCKDLVKIDATQIADRPLWALSIEVEVMRGLAVLEKLLSRLIDPHLNQS